METMTGPVGEPPLAAIAEDRRRFGLGDLMILVAAMAVTLGLVRSVVTASGRVPAWGYCLAVAVAGALAGTPALLALRLRAPRPSLPELTRQPGFAASLAGTAVLGLGAIAIGILAVLRLARRVVIVPGSPPPFRQSGSDWWQGVVVHFVPNVGPAIIAAWLLLALSGRRCPGRGWLDPLGRALGVVWIIIFVINACLRLDSLQK